MEKSTEMIKQHNQQQQKQKKTETFSINAQKLN